MVDGWVRGYIVSLWYLCCLMFCYAEAPTIIRVQLNDDIVLTSLTATVVFQHKISMPLSHNQWLL